MWGFIGLRTSENLHSELIRRLTPRLPRRYDFRVSQRPLCSKSAFTGSLCKASNAYVGKTCLVLRFCCKDADTREGTSHVLHVFQRGGVRTPAQGRRLGVGAGVPPGEESGVGSWGRRWRKWLTQPWVSQLALGEQWLPRLIHIQGVWSLVLYEQGQSREDCELWELGKAALASAPAWCSVWLVVALTSLLQALRSSPAARGTNSSSQLLCCEHLLQCKVRREALRKTPFPVFHAPIFTYLVLHHLAF